MSEEKSTMKPEVGVEGNNFDPHIVPAETGARIEREGDNFKTTPNKGKEETAKTNDQTDAESVDSTGGYTVDKEGLVNNYAIEPEMYINKPGDLQEKEENDTAERVNELEEVNKDKDGDLTVESDRRGKGSGII
jgi:hypothetical protein